MLRTTMTFGAVLTFATAAAAQPALPGFGPGAPFVRPSAPTPTMGFLPSVAPRGFSYSPFSPFTGFAGPFGVGVYGAYPFGAGAYGPYPFGAGLTMSYPFGSGLYGAAPYSVYATGAPYPPPLTTSASLQPSEPERNAVLANEFPAKLTLQFPAAAEVWLDGKKVDGMSAEEQVLTSRVLKPGEQYTFVVKGRWTSGGKTYETERKVTLGPGDRSRLMILSGDEVKK
jgi:uncharacterized protein (TIGR03000 family)